MANFGFIKCSRRERLKFFESSLPYLNNNALILSATGKAKRWSLEEPHSTNQSFLTFKNGHYGIYFTLFNHELRKKDHDPNTSNSNNIIVLVRETSSPSFFPEFSISKAKQEIYNDVIWLKSITKNLLSTTSLIRLNYAFQQLYQSRKFSTSALKAKEKSSGRPPHQSFEKLENLTKINPENGVPYEEPSHASEVPDGEHEPFEERFLRSQVTQIRQAFENYVSAEDLNVIFPMYQSLKRNDILLPSIEEYNMVLKSVAMRSLDGETTLTAMESKLTCLLTIYQDILSAALIHAHCRPNAETFLIVLGSLFKGSKDILSILEQMPSHAHHYRSIKVLEFCQVGVRLYTSLQDDARIEVDHVLPNMFYCLNVFPPLLSKDLAHSFYNLKEHKLNRAEFYTGLLTLTKALGEPLAMGFDKRQSYDFISGVFETYKLQCERHQHLASAEYNVYSAMLQALIATNNFPVATKFLDDVILTYKNSIHTMKLAVTGTADISNLLSDYLLAFMDVGSVTHLDKSYDLLSSIKQVPYLPDVNVSVYNDMICRYINEYVKQEQVKTSLGKINVVNRAQERIHNKIWNLYNYVSIRKDFNPLKFSNSMQASSLELLLSLSIDLGDLPNVSRLIKEILLRNTYITDWSVSRKLCNFLCNFFAGEQSNYFEVMWSIVEQQAEQYKGDPVQLNDFLSEHVSFLLANSPKSLSFILNLSMVVEALESCNIQTCNLHGLRSLMLFLQEEAKHNTLTNIDKAKVMDYQARMINEFEDTENHYLDLHSDALDFKRSLHAAFIESYSTNHRGPFLTAQVLRAAESLNLPARSVEVKEVGTIHYRKDLTSLFNANYDAGVERFLQNFKEGYSFTEETWRAILKRNFLTDVLESGKVLAIPQFLKRLICSSERNLCIELLASMIKLNNDKVNIETFKILADHGYDDILKTNTILNSFVEFANKTKNHYFLMLVSKNLAKLASLNESKGWIAGFFERLNEAGMSAEIVSVVSRNFEFFNEGLEVRLPRDRAFLREVLIAYSKNGNEKEMSQVFEYHFSKPEKKEILLSSADLLSCLPKYYTALGCDDKSTKNLQEFADRSMGEATDLPTFLSTLRITRDFSKQSKIENTLPLALNILEKNDLLLMEDTYHANKDPLLNNERLFSTMIISLTKAARVLHDTSGAKITAKFEAVIKLCKAICLERISAETLGNIIQFLAATKSNNLLNILFNKFMINNTLMLSFNFYFLRVHVRTKSELMEILRMFEAGFRQNGDLINLKLVEEFRNVNE